MMISDKKLLISDIDLKTKRNLLKNEEFSSIFLEVKRDLLSLAKEKLLPEDGDLIEDADQFYRDHKLLLVLFRVLAVMPIERSQPGQISFSWKSIATIYAFLFYCVSSFTVFIIGRERLHILHTTKQFDEYIYAILFVIFLIPHFWIPFVGWGVAKEVAIYKSSWGIFQLRFQKITGTQLQFPRLKNLITIISIGCLLVAILFLLLLSALLDGFPLWHTAAYYHIMTMINMNCALWYINSRAIATASRALAECFRKVIANNCKAVTVSNYRSLWLNLNELLQMLGNAYARTYSTLCIFIFVNIVVATYGAFAEIVDHTEYGISFKEIGLIVCVAYQTTLLVVICNCSHYATLEVAKNTQKYLLSVDRRSIDVATKREIDFFLVAILLNPAVVNLKGYMNVNRELLTSSLATITIYLLVLIQFKFTLN